MRAIALVYVMLMPFMSALAPTEWTPMPLLVLIIVAPVLLVRSSPVNLAFVVRYDWPFAIMFLCGISGIWLSSLPSGSKNINYSLAVLVCYLFFFCVVRRLFCAISIRWEHVGRYCQWSLGMLSMAVLLEFYTASFHGIYFADVIHFAHKDLTVANLVTAEFKRPRAFSAEPGFTALAYECLWPLSLLARRQRWWLHLVIAGAFFMLASAAAMACMGLALAIVWITHSRDWRSAAKFLLLTLLTLGSLLATEVGQDIAWSVFGRKLDISGAWTFHDANDSKTLFDRLNSYDISMTLLMLHPLGIGWGSLGQVFADDLSLPGIGHLAGSGLLSLYLDIVVATGFIGLLFWLLFIGWRVRILLASSNQRTRSVAVALLAVSLHHMFITEIQMPFLWFALALADKLILDTRHQLASSRTSAHIHEYRPTLADSSQVEAQSSVTPATATTIRTF
jgi:hypothetical protein